MNKEETKTTRFPEVLGAGAAAAKSTEEIGTASLPEVSETEKLPEADFTDFYNESAANITMTDYPAKRGLSLETCRKYNIGYCENWRHPGVPNAPTSPRLIIPIGKQSYLARDTRENVNFAKQKAKCAETVSWFFNEDALYKSEAPIIIVEGEIDALSIIEVGCTAVSIGSTANVNSFLNTLAVRKPCQALILALDADKVGSEATELLAAGLESMNIPFYKSDLYCGCKDANELLVKDRAKLTANLAKYRSEDAFKYFLTSAEAYIKDFMAGIANNDHTCIPTGFPDLDIILGGGLYNGLIVLGAISSLGKTTLAIQIADNIAQSGKDVLYFSLEMSKDEIMAKSVSRHTLTIALRDGIDTRNAKSTCGILDGKRYESYNSTERQLIEKSIEEYSTYAGNLYIIEGDGNISADDISSKIENHIRITGRRPLVVVDYIQILKPHSDHMSDKQNIDYSISKLRCIARDFKTPVIGISSLNRASYKDKIAMEAYKESGSIEYSADTLIGLQFASAGTNYFDATAEKAKNPREIEAIILKNRNSKVGDKVCFNYYPVFNYFEEDHEKNAEKTK